MIIGLGGSFFSFFRREDLSLEDPNLHADDPISGLGLSQADNQCPPEAYGGEPDPRDTILCGPFLPLPSLPAQAILIPFAPSLRAEADGLLHGPSKSNPSLQLEGHILSHQLGIDLCPLDLLDVNEDLLAGHLLEFPFQVLHLCSLFPDDDAGPSRVDR